MLPSCAAVRLTLRYLCACRKPGSQPGKVVELKSLFQIESIQRAPSPADACGQFGKAGAFDSDPFANCQMPVASNAGPALGNIEDQRVVAPPAGVELDRNPQTQPDRTSALARGAFGQQFFERDRILEAKPAELAILPDSLDFVAIAARQFDREGDVDRQRMECFDPDPAMRNVAQHDKEFVLLRNQLGGPEEQSEARRDALVGYRRPSAPVAAGGGVGLSDR